jgi:hypothetical protein
VTGTISQRICSYQMANEAARRASGLVAGRQSITVVPPLRLKKSKVSSHHL